MGLAIGNFTAVTITHVFSKKKKEVSGLRDLF
jgi:hypothetical protein